MSKIKGKQQNRPSPATIKNNSVKPAKRGLSIENWNMLTPSVQAIVIACIAALTWLFFSTCLDNQLTNWDDPGYVKDNALIKDLSPDGLKNIFSTAIMGNYHPLTILSYAIEYSFVRLQPWLYHLDSLLLHIFVTVLVYFFVLLLTKRSVAAAVTALLFGLHPMHVESVAWIAGRKDVVYSSFYLLACLAYIRYIRAQDRKPLWYSLVIILFVCSLLAKPVIVVLPLVLLLIDYFEERKISWILLVEKIPHFAISIGFGIKSLHDQKVFGSIGTQSVTHNLLEHICLGTYALVTYLWKAVIPVQLCNFYPYPDRLDGHGLPFYLYIYPLAVIAIAVAIWIFSRRKKVVVFGVLFFLINILLLLQFLPVGGAILADRYTYIPYLGLFFIAGWYISGLFEPDGNKALRSPVAIITLAYALVLGYLSHERCQVWYDTTTLWMDEIEKEPVRAPNAYNNLGFHYFNKFNDEVNPSIRKVYYDSASMFLNKAIELQPNFANPYISLGELLRSSGNFPEAKIKYYTAIHLQSAFENANAYLGLGIIYAISRMYDSSEFCFRKAIELKPYFPEAHSNFGNFYDMTGRHEEALKEYGIAVSQNPDMCAPYLNRGRTYQRMHRCDEAMKDFEIALSLSPGMGEIYYARSFCFTQQGKAAAALQDVEKAISLGYTRIDKNYYQMLKSSAH